MYVTVPKPLLNKENNLPNPHASGVMYNYGECLEPWKPVVIYNNYGEPVYMSQSYYYMINRRWRQSLFHRQERKVVPYRF